MHKKREKVKQEAAGMWLKIKYITLEETGEKEQMQRTELEKNKVQYNKKREKKEKSMMVSEINGSVAMLHTSTTTTSN